MTIKSLLDVIKWLVGDVGGNHVLDLHGYLGVRLDDAVGLYIDRPDRASDSLLSSGENSYNESHQSKENHQANQTYSYRTEYRRSDFLSSNIPSRRMMWNTIAWSYTLSIATCIASSIRS